MRNVIFGIAILMAILHQDFWYWDDPAFVFGFLPIGLAYHLFFSVATGVLWAFAVIFAWPSDVEEEVKEALAEMESPSAS